MDTSNRKWRRRKSKEWTGINKEVVYIFLGPGGNMTTDHHQPVRDQCSGAGVKVLDLGRMKNSTLPNG